MVRIKQSSRRKRQWTVQTLTVLTLLFIATTFLGTIFMFTAILTTTPTQQDEPSNIRSVKVADEANANKADSSKSRELSHEEKVKTLRDWKLNGLSKPAPSYPGVDPPIASILQTARAELTPAQSSQLPTWQDVTSQYGDKPIIHGLERCAEYRSKVKPQDRMIGPAGIFNTGTNLFFQVMKENCNITGAAASPSHDEPRKNGIRYQVPWGKHNPVSVHRLHNVAPAWGGGIKQEDVMPFVLIKDPYHWMGSECRHEYLLEWDHDGEHCPNVLDGSIEDRDVPNGVVSKYAKKTVRYDSLVDVWNTWYREWEVQDFPVIKTRFEDLVFHAEYVLKTSCECVGGVFADDFVFIERNAKEDLPLNEGTNGLVKTLIQYGNSKNRLEGFTERELRYVSRELDEGLMKKFGYVPPPLP